MLYCDDWTFYQTVNLICGPMTFTKLRLSTHGRRKPLHTVGLVSDLLQDQAERRVQGFHTTPHAGEGVSLYIYSPVQSSDCRRAAFRTRLRFLPLSVENHATTVDRFSLVLRFLPVLLPGQLFRAAWLLLRSYMNNLQLDTGIFANAEGPTTRAVTPIKKLFFFASLSCPLCRRVHVLCWL